MMRTSITALFLICLALSSTALAQQTVYVDDDSLCPGTGTIGDPFCSIMDAVCNIKDSGGGTVWVSPGYYNEAIILFPDVSIISTDGPAVTTIDGNGQQCYTRDCVFNTSTTHCSTVIISSLDGIGPTNADRLEGFHITGGQGFLWDNAGSDPDLLVGGGIFVFGNSAPTITNNEIAGNILADGSNPDIWYGGGIYIHSNMASWDPARPVITNNLIEGNIVNSPEGSSAASSYSVGGGIYAGYHSIPVIEGNTIRGNRTGDLVTENQFASGGGIAIYSLSSLPDVPVITRNIIEGNDGTDKGGGISSSARFDGDVGGYVPTFGSISDNLIWYNTAGEGGGFMFSNVLSTVTNNTIVDNLAAYGGGVNVGVTVNVGEELTLTNNIVALNYAELVGGGLYVYQAEPVVRYNDIHGNTATVSMTTSEVDGDKSDPDYIGMEGNISVDPLFVSTTPGSEDFQVQVGSPTIDAGNNTDASTIDLVGQARIQDGDASGTAVVDMGAYELAADFDGDNVPDYLDPDDDNDGVLDESDCADFTVGISNAPNRIGDTLVIDKAIGDVVLSWKQVAQGAASNVYRGNFTGDGTWPYDEACLFTEVLDRQAVDNDIPLLNEGFYYLVSAVNICGESEAGLASDGPVTPAAPCVMVNGDFDLDGVADLEDNCSLVSNASQADGDLDFAGDLCDNCPSSANPDQIDTDLDSQGNVCDLDDDDDGTLDENDCAPLNPDAAAEPPEVAGVTVNRSGADAVISWNLEPSATRYDLAGGFLQDMVITGDTSLAACLAADVNSSSWTDTRSAPISGEGYYYLVRGEEVCSGSYGNDSGGSPRLMPATCP